MIYFCPVSIRSPRILSTSSQESDFQLTVTDDLEDAAKKAVAIAQIVTLAENAKLDISITAAV